MFLGEFLSMEDDLISIIVPIYNVEKYIEHCLYSIKNQTYKNIEVILVNDGTTDRTIDIVKNNFLLDQRFKLVSQNNAGISVARNNGISNSKGKYIVFVDSDDWVAPDYVEYLYYLIKKHNVKISTCAHQSLPRGTSPRIIKDPKDYIISTKEYFRRLGDKELPFQLGVAPWGRMYERSLFKDIKYPEGELFEDSATTYKLYLSAGMTAIGESIKYLYFQNKNSIVQKEFSKTRFQFLDSEKKMKDDLEKKFPDIKESLDRRYQYALMNTLAHIVISPNSKEFRKEQLELKKKILGNFTKKMLDAKNSKKDLVGLITLRLGLPFYKIAFKLFKFFKNKK